MLARCIRIRLMVPTAGGIALRPFVPDTTDRSRFPPVIRFEAQLFGIGVGTMDITTDGPTGRILDVSVRRGWPRATIAARLLAEAEQVARLASWQRLAWTPSS